MEEKIYRLNVAKNPTRIISKLKTDQSQVISRIKQKIKQKANREINEQRKWKLITSLSSSGMSKRRKQSISKSCLLKSPEKMNKPEFPVLVYSNKKRQKIIQQMAIENSESFLIIGRASIHEKQQNTSNNSLASRRSSLQSLNEIQNISNIYENMPMKPKSKVSKLSGFYFRHNTQIINQDLKDSKNGGISKENPRRSNLIAKTQLIFYQNLRKYLEVIERSCNLNLVEYKPLEKYTKNNPIYKIDDSNSNIVETALKKRWWWRKGKETITQNPSLLWTQMKKDDFFSSNKKIMYPGFIQIDLIQQKLQQEQKNQTRLHNHIKNNKYITSKIALFEITNKLKGTNLKIPKKYYIHHKTSKYWEKFQTENYMDTKRKVKNILLNYLQENNKMWIVKSAQHQNKNHYLEIFNSHEAIQHFLGNHLSAKQTFIIEEYIQNPFLYKNRKFNVKSFVLITKLQKNLKVYWYNDGFLQLASQDYDKNDTNPYIHFASEVIQINHPRYGELKQSNKLTFQQFQTYLNSIDNKSYNFQRDAVPIMKQTAKIIIQSVTNKLTQQNSASFQLIELNYVMDSSFVPWLISAHTNPCLEGSCAILEKFMPKLIDDVFKLTIDMYYPPPKTWPKSKYYLLSKNICDNGFEEIRLYVDSSRVMDTFEFEKNIDDEKRCYDNNIEQNEVALMHFFPEKMKSASIKSINFEK